MPSTLRFLSYQIFKESHEVLLVSPFYRGGN